jgi:hypothetical protein
MSGEYLTGVMKKSDRGVFEMVWAACESRGARARLVFEPAAPVAIGIGRSGDGHHSVNRIVRLEMSAEGQPLPSRFHAKHTKP